LSLACDSTIGITSNSALLAGDGLNVWLNVTFARNISAPLDRPNILSIAPLLKVINIKKMYRRRLSMNESVLCAKKSEVEFLSHGLGDLGVKYALHLYVVGKRVIDFL